MAQFVATVKYSDTREIVIEADTLEEAQAKYDAGEWESEDTIDFYAEEEVKPLRPAS